MEEVVSFHNSENQEEQNTVNDDNEQTYKHWFIDIIKDSDTELCRNIVTKITNKEIDIELDLLLRQLNEIAPYNIFIPSLRDQLELTITTDDKCVSTLNSIKSYLTNKADINMIDKIIEFITSDEGELDDEIVPGIDLMSLIELIPIEKIPDLYNCIDYIEEITE